MQELKYSFEFTIQMSILMRFINFFPQPPGHS